MGGIIGYQHFQFYFYWRYNYEFTNIFVNDNNIGTNIQRNVKNRQQH